MVVMREVMEVIEAKEMMAKEKGVKKFMYRLCVFAKTRDSCAKTDKKVA